jgi:hypothetical protein
MGTNNTAQRGSLAALRQFVRSNAPTAKPERCELCSAAVAEEHQHLFELATARIVCACEPCAILFGSQAAPRFRRIPKRIRSFDRFSIDDAQWENLTIPIDLAFIYYSSAAGKTVAYYPSPAGAVESLLDLESWTEIVEQNPVLRQLEPDVEALLINRTNSRAEYFLVPIDQCFRLVGLMRTHWRGLAGGSEVWRHIQRFFAELKARSTRAAND